MIKHHIDATETVKEFRKSLPSIFSNQKKKKELRNPGNCQNSIGIELERNAQNCAPKVSTIPVEKYIKVKAISHAREFITKWRNKRREMEITCVVWNLDKVYSRERKLGLNFFPSQFLNVSIYEFLG